MCQTHFAGPAWRSKPGRSGLARGNESMFKGLAEEKRQPVGIDTPDEGLDVERRPVGGNQLQLGRGTGL